MCALHEQPGGEGGCEKACKGVGGGACQADCGGESLFHAEDYGRLGRCKIFLHEMTEASPSFMDANSPTALLDMGRPAQLHRHNDLQHTFVEEMSASVVAEVKAVSRTATSRWLEPKALQKHCG